MALSGHLSDLSLSELIEFFCNQRKTGQLKVLYPNGAGYFYLQAGSVVDARIGVLHGIDAVYYALTLPNAEFEFSAEALSVHRTINQPWTQVVLEGLRRLDEGISPGVAFPSDYVPEADELSAPVQEEYVNDDSHKSFTPAFFSFVAKDTMSGRKPLFIGAIVVAVLASVAVIGVPAGWYKTSKSNVASAPVVPATAPQATTGSSSSVPVDPPAATHTDDAAAIAAKRQKDKKVREAKVATESASVAPTQVGGKGGKRVVVTVSYDESGRVTQASGNDATALRIARQKRFPPGKAGSATVTIPIN